MPNRIDTNAQVARPTFGQNEAQQATRASERVQPETLPAQRDRVDISEQALLQAEQSQNRVGEVNVRDRSGADQAPSARPEAGDQGVNLATVRQAEQLRETQETRVQERPKRPEEQQGNFVDLVG